MKKKINGKILTDRKIPNILKRLLNKWTNINFHDKSGKRKRYQEILHIHNQRDEETDTYIAKRINECKHM